MKTTKKILFFDLETDGVQPLNADMGFVLCFGYQWGIGGKPHVANLLTHPGKHSQDDENLLKFASSIIEQADLIVAHFGDGFDRPYLEARLRRYRLPPLPNVKLVDTCRISQKKYRLSNNRLKTLANFFQLDTRKMEKGDGWPRWWLEALRADQPLIRSRAIKAMSVYCGFDVKCLSEVFMVELPNIPGKYLIPLQERGSCATCGGEVQYRGFHNSEKRKFKQYQCKVCGRWGHEKKAVEEPKPPSCKHRIWKDSSGSFRIS